MENIWFVLAVFWSGALALTMGMIGGGLLVLVTKREAHELAGLIRKPAEIPTPTPINIDELAINEEPEDDNHDVVPDIFAAKHNDFLSQVAKEGRMNNAE